MKAPVEPAGRSGTTVVNVASVPQRSPFRYPGGKSWLIPTVRTWLGSLPRKPRLFVEPFAGGGSISLTVAFEQLATRVIMVELDPEIGAVWSAILQGDAERLAKRISGFNLTQESVRLELGSSPRTVERRAFQTILKNRVFHGGILAPGSGMLKRGENGRGLHSRWYPDTLAKRITDAGTLREKIEFVEGDGLSVVSQLKSRTGAVFFIDPPYTVSGKGAGKRLYRYHELDHERLFQLCKTLSGDFLMTYDDDRDVRELARMNGFETKTIPMRNTHHHTKCELLVGRDLSWVRTAK